MPAAAAASRTGRGAGPPPISTASNSASAAVGRRIGRAPWPTAWRPATCIAVPEPSSLYGRGQFGDVEAGRDVQLDGRGAGEHAAHQHLDAGDVIRRQRPAASCPARRGGHGWPPRWRSARRRSSSAPLGVPVVPDVVTTRATSSSMASPTRSAGSVDSGRRGATGTSAESRPSSTRCSAGNSGRGRGARRDGERAQDGYRGLHRVAGVVERPALGGQPRPDPLDVLR